MAPEIQASWRPEKLRCDRQSRPAGLAGGSPVFAWRLPAGAGDAAQDGYQLAVGSTEASAGAEADVWDSGWRSSATASAVYGGPPLASRQSLYWSVRVRTSSGGASAWAVPARFDVGLLHREDWHALWVARPARAGHQRAAYLLRRRFHLTAKPVAARAFVTALGAYELWANGARAGDALMRPGWTDHRRRVQYQVYDLTDHLRAGDNVLGAVLAPGWYGGRISSQVPPGSDDPVPVPELLCQLELGPGPGSGDPELIGTDERWEWRSSPITSSDLYDGEDWDCRLVSGRSSAGAGAFGAGAFGGGAFGEGAGDWSPVEVGRGTAGAIVPELAGELRVTREAPAAVTWRSDGTAVVEDARNDTGYLRLEVQTTPGRRVSVHYGEILDDAGRVYRENLRSARCTDTFICTGEGPEVLAPVFSYRGWRYAEVEGLGSPEELRSAVGVGMRTAMDRTGWFTCSDPFLQQIYELMVCSLEANFVEVPTDCPQRDERMGWMADAMLFAPIAAYTYDISAFMAKWAVDVLDARTPDGGFADIAPRPSALWPPRSYEAGAPAWADAGVHVPWLMYERYGDRRLLEDMFPAMLQWLRLVHGQNPSGIWANGRGHDYGDWVPAGPDTSHDLFSTAWLYRSSAIGAEVARLLGENEPARWLAERAEAVKKAFAERFVDADRGWVGDASIHAAPPGTEPKNGVLGPETQAGYVLALTLGLLGQDVAVRAGHRLAGLVSAAGKRLATGFCGSAYILAALERAGYPGLAYDLLLRRELPSLGFMVEMGSTSVWERWDGLDDERRPYEPSMNSYNHYAMSSMLSWLVEGVCGLRPVAGAPALGQVNFAPALTRRLDWAAFCFDAPAGRLELRWEWAGGTAVVGTVLVPPGMTCTIAPALVLDDGRHAVADAAAGTGLSAPLSAGSHEVTWRVS